jgi:hypothetical protein
LAVIGAKFATLAKREGTTDLTARAILDPGIEAMQIIKDGHGLAFHSPAGCFIRTAQPTKGMIS